ncbi:MAG: hypothetical protein HF976_00120 [ANME-2 cluster archaeon]|nr:hypothetical protein [ANME-2 cluster archaeon]MBC2699822.1 hypothetical protein [ANME-2 cluster archaeon]MBC2707044.1 hypothetical protein [ANME-2 cluster archaeon]MBC2748005.1 hypothetical protein [ANME-2 cluster archaeon]MBC2764069.1 hypothetical protein [ANME-2 cluster archaeon]
MPSFSQVRADQPYGCKTSDENCQRINEQEKRLGWDSNPSIPYDTTVLETEAFERSEKAEDKKIAAAIFDSRIYTPKSHTAPLD